MRFLKFSFFLSVVVILFCLFFHNIIEFDQDLGRHLLMGKIIWQTGSVPKVNLLSYTYPDLQFINSHWFSEVIFFQIAAVFRGVMALLYFKTVILLVAFTLTTYTAYLYSRNLLVTAVAFVIFTPVLLERTEIRPEIFSYLFVATFLFVLIAHYELRIKYYGKILWLLPFIQILWVNAHIYFILGPILAGVFYGRQFWREFSSKHHFLKTILKTKNQLLFTLATVLACLINPNGISGALYPLRVFDNYGYSIVENQNVFFLGRVVFNPNILYFWIGFAFLAASFALCDWKKINLITLGLAGLAILPILAIRSFPLLFLLEVPVVAFNLSHLNPKLPNLVKGEQKSLTNVVIAGCILLTCYRAVRLVTNDYYLSIDSHKRFGNIVSESGKGAVDFALKNKLRGPIFNNFDIGSYLDYRLYPKERVFIDGRPEAYPAKFIQGVYIPMQMSAENFKTIDKIYKFNLIIFSHTDATPWAESFMTDIIHNSDYALVYLDDYAFVFVKKSTSSEIARKYSVSPQSLSNNYSYLSALSLARIANIFGWNEASLKLLQEAYAKNPNSNSVNQALGIIYSGSQSTSSLGQIYLAKYRQRGVIFF